ncbi:hypothetical protein AAHE18_12G053800 [Arachis hypogaea]
MDISICSHWVGFSTDIVSDPHSTAFRAQFAGFLKALGAQFVGFLTEELAIFSADKCGFFECIYVILALCTLDGNVDKLCKNLQGFLLHLPASQYLHVGGVVPLNLSVLLVVVIIAIILGKKNTIQITSGTQYSHQ